MQINLPSALASSVGYPKTGEEYSLLPVPYSLFLNYDVLGKSAGDGLGELFEMCNVLFAIVGIGAEAHFEYNVLAIEVKHCKTFVRCLIFGFYATNVGLQGMCCGVEEAHCDSDFEVGGIIGDDNFGSIGSVV